MFKKDKADIIRSITETGQHLQEEVNKKNEKVDELEKFCNELEIKVNKRLNDFYKEFTDRYFETMSAFLRWNKEISLVSFLGGREPNLDKLKKELMRPMTEENWGKTNAVEADKINTALSSKGEKVRKAWNRYKDTLLQLERQGKDTQLVKAKLEVLDLLMEEEAK